MVICLHYGKDIQILRPKTNAAAPALNWPKRRFGSATRGAVVSFALFSLRAFFRAMVSGWHPISGWENKTETTHNVITGHIMILDVKKKIIVLCLSAGMFLWFLDALLDFYYKHPTKTFIQSLLYDEPIHELFARIFLSAVVMALGFVISGKIYLRKSRDELDLRVQERTAQLSIANEELRQIPSKLISVLEEERKRLASELHDSIGQTLAAVKFWVEMALKLRDAGDGNAAFKHL
jgi:signal transduction histidine kinase